MLKLEGISTQYGGVPMLRKVSMEIEKGELVCLLGSNGAGKTTTMKTILRLVSLVEGSIFFEGRPIHSWKPHQVVGAGISVVPEGRRLFPKMTALENLRLGAFSEKDEGEIQKRLETIYRLFPRLQERLNQVAGTMSGGEQGMVAIGRGMMGKPKILLLDEPSLGLSPILVEEFVKTIKRINEEGNTILLIEQNAKKALSIASKGYVLQKGEIVVKGNRSELFQSDLIQKAYLRG
ncbi:MAG: ABC transporter ATP-binding protein [Deltaproteobacteria bacterium RBG_16_49_23]|nr:MAG: ABC transporter ATP-binding protein [Deltaproteobacteria bacterium RBG_16_49_23]